MGRTGLTSDVGSGDLFIAFSTSYVFARTRKLRDSGTRAARSSKTKTQLDALYRATAEATQAAIYDALFESKTTVGREGNTVYGLPVSRVLTLLHQAGAI